MIKFGETFVKSDINGINLPENYQRIHPIENMNDKDVDDFWTQEFSKYQTEKGMEDYGDLKSEIFNRSEDEIQIDFPIEKSSILALEKFMPETWQNLTEQEKYNAVYDLTKEVSVALELSEIPEIKIFEADETYCGEYDLGKNTISLNHIIFDNPYELVDTITHETRHAYQYMRSEILDTKEDALFKCNFENYITPLQLPDGGYLNFTDYYDQYVEADARAFANLFTEAML
jgi:hypothetical protein